MTALTVYVFFATWCAPCRHELPRIAELDARWRDRGVRLVLVSTDAPSSAAEVAPFLGRLGLEGAEVVLDAESTLTARYNPTASLPYVAVVDAAGQVVYAHAGYEPGDERLLEAALAAHAPPPADQLGRPLGWSVTSQTVALRREDDFAVAGPEGAVTGGVARLEVAAARGSLSAMTRIDGAIFRGAADAEDVRLEKAALEGAIGPLRLRAGDGHAALGHGLLLSVRKIDPLGVDTTVRGGRVDLGAGPVAITALAGVLNPQNVDTIALEIQDDPGDLVAGLQVRETLAAGVSLGQEGLVSRAPGAAPDGADLDVLLGGLTADVGRPGLRLAGEVVAGAARGAAAGGEAQPVHGLYASAGGDLGPVTVLLEGKWYRRLFVGRPERGLYYHEPPTLERDDQEVPGNQDAAGGRLRLEWRLAPWASVHVGALGYRFREDGGDPLGDAARVLHGYAGAEARWPSGATLAGSAGLRDEDDADGADRLAAVQLTADGAAPLGPLGVVARWDHRFERKLTFDGQNRYARGLAVAGLSWPGRGALSLAWGYSGEVAVRPTHYPGAELRVLLGEHGDVRLFGGRQAGGRVCVAGACRDLPPFEGARLDVILRL